MILFLLMTPVSTLAHSNNSEGVFHSASNGSWTEMSPAVAPQNRVDSDLVYDSQSDMVILFGGRYPLIDDTWVYSYEDDTWTEMTPALAPDVRSGHGLAYDSQSDRVILFGGFKEFDGNDKHVNYNETWAYDYDSNTWINMEPAFMPSARCKGTMAYDEESDRVILFGGILDGTIFALDFWAYDYNSNTWENMTDIMEAGIGYQREHNPRARYDAPMAYNSEADQIILYSGFGATALRDTWIYDYNVNTWSKPWPTGYPTEIPGTLAYNSEDDICVFFGGTFDFEETSLSSETWILNYTLDERPAWINANPLNSPTARSRAPLAYDVDSNRIIMFGGKGSSGVVYNDTWAYGQHIDSEDSLDVILLLVGIAVVAIGVIVVFTKRR
jgi:hypothetical protein